jgi:hypothetical protein
MNTGKAKMSTACFGFFCFGGMAFRPLPLHAQTHEHESIHRRYTYRLPLTFIE